MASMMESNLSNDDIQDSIRSSTYHMADVTNASRVKHSFWDDDVKKDNSVYLEKSPTDEFEPHFTGICFLPNNMIILCDYANKKLKLLEENKLKYEEKCEGAPYDVDKLNKTDVMITLPDAMELLVVTVKPGVKVIRKIDIKASCYGIAIQNEKIFLCAYENETSVRGSISSSQKKQFIGIKVIDLEGNTKQQLQHMGPGHPKYLCLNEEGNKIFYSGGSNFDSFILCKQTDELAIYKYVKDLQMPMSIVLDECENVAFCDLKTKKVNAIKSNGVSCRCLMTEKSKLHEPTTLSYDKTKGVLCVVCSVAKESFGDRNKKKACTKLKLYKLEQKAELARKARKDISTL